jgi:hypothetical protein
LENAFEVEIEGKKSVSVLKELIKEKAKNTWMPTASSVDTSPER